MVHHYAFSSSLAAMKAQSRALEVIGINVTNVSTAGYKAQKTQFQEMIQTTDRGSTTDNYSGVRPLLKNMFDRDGQVANTARPYDAAMLGNGFFITSDTPAATGNLSLTKAGQFNPTVDPNSTTNQTYLTDATGHYLLGWPYNTSRRTAFTTGTTTASLQPIQIDPNNTFAAIATTARKSVDAPTSLLTRLWAIPSPPRFRFLTAPVMLTMSPISGTLDVTWTKDRHQHLGCDISPQPAARSSPHQRPPCR